MSTMPYPFYGIPNYNFHNNNYSSSPPQFLNHPAPGYAHFTPTPIYPGPGCAMNRNFSNSNYITNDYGRIHEMPPRKTSNGYIPFYYPPLTQHPVQQQANMHVNQCSQQHFQGYPPFYQQGNPHPHQLSREKSKNRSNFAPFPSY